MPTEAQIRSEASRKAWRSRKRQDRARGGLCAPTVAKPSTKPRVGYAAIIAATRPEASSAVIARELGLNPAYVRKVWQIMGLAPRPVGKRPAQCALTRGPRMEAHNWYRVSDLPPPPNAHVWLQWSGREFKGFRKVDGKREMWIEVMRGGAERGVRIPVGNLILWRPQFADKWKLPLPEPVVSPTGGMHSIGQRFDSVSSAEMAEEMEADREATRANRDLGPTDDPFKRWWRDLSNIQYEPTGSVSLKMAEGRTMRALAHCGHRQRQGVALANSGALAALGVAAEQALRAQAEAESKGVGVEWRVPFRPMPADYQDFDLAMGWIVALNPPDYWHAQRKAWALNKTQKIMLWRAIDTPMTWADIGVWLKISGKVAKGIFDGGVAACHRVANGRPAYPHRVPVDQIAALKERNREAKRI